MTGQTRQTKHRQDPLGQSRGSQTSGTLSYASRANVMLTWTACLNNSTCVSDRVTESITTETLNGYVIVAVAPLAKYADSHVNQLHMTNWRNAWRVNVKLYFSVDTNELMQILYGASMFRSLPVASIFVSLFVPTCVIQYHLLCTCTNSRPFSPFHCIATNRPCLSALPL